LLALGAALTFQTLSVGSALAASTAGTVARRTPAATPAAARSLPHAVLVKPKVPSGTYLGVDPEFDPNIDRSVQAAEFAGDIGREPAIVSFYITWTQPLPAALGSVSEVGSLPMVSWQCGAQDTDIAAGKDDSIIKAMAEQFKAFYRPVLLRWFWEMNLDGHHTACEGSGSVASQAAGYIAAWKHIWTIFQQVGATNVGFVWCPSAAAKAGGATPFFPGKAYVDWIGGDVYDRSTYNNNFASVFAPYYKVFSTYGLPMAVCETGATATPAPSGQAPWLENIAASVPTEFPDLHALIYVDATDIYDYILQPGTSGMAEFAAMGHEPRFSSFAFVTQGYGFATSNGGVRTYGQTYYGHTSGTLPAPIVGFAEAARGTGYWLTGADGSIYTFGEALGHGSMRGKHLNKPIVAMAATPDGKGYWLVASDGGIFSFGDARFHGSTGNIHLNKPIVGMTATADGKGYWLVASDGGIFAFGDARFHGSTGNIHLNKPIAGMTTTQGGLGYWLVANDGGVFAFGDAHYGGSFGGNPLSSPVVSVAPDLVTGYYFVLTAGGSVYAFPGGLEVSATPLPTPAVQMGSVSLQE
jgi:hypothetical protein